ncbi:Acetyltransferase (GNAT) family protein [Chitinophaga terrae (ex Kim and Jung 2007)]|uniref:Acetyltransferase (GNAT) family protein n=2 Tax=Chitinophaga terrae (ex Kim and Jung 2007) TaxID=408074 RepID=A0A1H4GN65_9BACT|nr:Acetyltransferase (GNAT) family protein [Chitinophaga terrae (ex Kim and Jung 2007)]
MFEKRGIGRRLHDTMLNWYFSQTRAGIWLGTAPRTRAAAFYRESGWKETCTHGKGEIRFEMSFEEWKQQQETNSER